MPTNQSVVYAIINIANDKHYIGSTVKFKIRKYKHENELANNRHHSHHLQFSYNKYGSHNFIFAVLEICWPFQLLEREQWWINKLKPEYNTALVAGSPLGLKRSEETKRKISEAQKYRLPASEETRLKMSTSAKTKLFSDSHKINMAKAKIGRKHSEETKLKMSLAARKPKSKEHSKNMGLTKRKSDKWPHEKGSRCRCNECKIKINERNRLKYAQKKLVK